MQFPASPSSPRTSTPQPYAGQADIDNNGVLGLRLFAYCVDFLLILFFTLIMAFGVFLLGIITFGLGWLLFAVLVPGTAILYSALTLGGANQATIGMNMAGIRGIKSNGTAIDGLTAAVHALLFYVAAGTFLLLVLDLLVGFTRSDKRLGHDLLVGVIIMRKADIQDINGAGDVM